MGCFTFTSTQRPFLLNAKMAVNAPVKKWWDPDISWDLKSVKQKYTPLYPRVQRRKRYS